MASAHIRQLMRERTSSDKLPSKLCGYNSNGQLVCKICKTVIKSITLWKTHERSIKHKQRLEYLRNVKKEKSSTSQTNGNTVNNNEEKNKSSHKSEDGKKEKHETVSTMSVLGSQIPSDFFDAAMMDRIPKNKKDESTNGACHSDDSDDSNDSDDSDNNDKYNDDDNDNAGHFEIVGASNIKSNWNKKNKDSRNEKEKRNKKNDMDFQSIIATDDTRCEIVFDKYSTV